MPTLAASTKDVLSSTSWSPTFRFSTFQLPSEKLGENEFIIHTKCRVVCYLMVHISIIYPFFATQSNLQNLLHSLKQKQHLKKGQKETRIPTIHFQVRTVDFRKSNHNPNNQMLFIQKNDTTPSPGSLNLHGCSSPAPTPTRWSCWWFSKSRWSQLICWISEFLLGIHTINLYSVSIYKYIYIVVCII